MIVYGERLLAGPGGAQAARALLNLASRLGLAGRDGAGLLEAPSSHQRARPARGRLRARPRPRLRDARRARRATPRASPQALAGGELSTVWLHHADPLRAFPDRAAWEAALGAAQTVIAVDSVLTDTIREHADVVFPAEAYAEKEGTLTHPDGRVQRLRPAIGRPKGPDQQSGSGVRPLWQVIADVAERDRARARRPHGPDGLAAAVRGRAVLRRADARRDRRPRRPLARLRGGARRSRPRPWEPAKLEVPARRAGDGRRRAAPGHVPLAVELQGGRRLARRCASCARARSSSSRPPTPSGSASATATRSRSAPTGRACKGAVQAARRGARAAPCSSPRARTSSPPTCSPSRWSRCAASARAGERRAERRRRDRGAGRRGPGGDAAVRAARHPARGPGQSEDGST